MDDHCNNFFHRVLRGGTSVGKRERGSGLYSSITHPPTHPLASFCVNGVIRMLSSNPYDFVFYVRPLTHIRYRYQQL